MRYFRTLALLASLTGGAQEPTRLQSFNAANLLHEILRVSQSNSLAIGIIQSDDQALCREVSDVALSQEPEPKQVLQRLATQAGYVTSEIEGAIVFSPKSVDSILEREHKFVSFPELKDETMQSMGAVLQGRLSVAINHSTSYVNESAYSDEAQMLSLKTYNNATALQIASRIVGLGSKGVWMLSEERDRITDASLVRLRAYSYKDDSGDIDHLDCSG